MRTRTAWGVVLLAAAAVLSPSAGRGQESIGRPDPQIWLPLGHDRMENGGFYATGEFLFWRQTNPIKEQPIAIRGIKDTDGSIQAANELLLGNTTDPIIPGKFFGSGALALDSYQVSGPNNYSPGFGLTLGWKFADGVAVEFQWHHLQTVKLNAVASVLGPTLSAGENQSDTFLFSPVYNFNNDFAGPVNKIAVTGKFGVLSTGSNASATTTFPPITITNAGLVILGGNTVSSAIASSNGSVVVPQAAYGIWNAATIMTLSFIQRYDDFDLIGRVPIYQDENFRCYGLVGPRNVHMWERFSWRTVDVDVAVPNGQSSATSTLTLGTITQTTNNGTVNAQTTTVPLIVTTNTATAGGGSQVGGGQSQPDWAATYSNVISQEMYGPMIGTGCECYLGGGFSASLDTRAAALLNIVKEEAKYERQDRIAQNKRARRDYTIVPELDAILNLWWYPIEGVQINVGYNFMGYFNTVASPHPVDFNFGELTPGWEKGHFRMVDGWTAGISLIF